MLPPQAKVLSYILDAQKLLRQARGWLAGCLLYAR